MKISFKLLVLGARSTSKLTRLRAICASGQVAEVTSDDLFALAPEQLAQQVVFIAGESPADKLSELVLQLADSNAVPILVADALHGKGAEFSSVKAYFETTLNKLAEKRIQATVVAQVKGLISSKRLMLYQFAKADTTATIMVVLHAGTSKARVLTITRLHAPFADEESFPGGFLNPHTESLPQCGAREGSEETSVRVPENQLLLLDVRSNPGRDERGHVVDHGYLWLVPDNMAERVLASAQAGDDAKAGSARFVPVLTLLKSGKMAFDHYDLLLAALRTGKVLPPQRLVLRLLHACQRVLSKLSARFEKSDAVYGRFH
jgi:ADP-ribose pyrophosphatase YjhB (NUDIX family)